MKARISIIIGYVSHYSTGLV